MLDAVRAEAKHKRVTIPVRKAAARYLAGYSDDFDVLAGDEADAARRADALAADLAASMFAAAASAAARSEDLETKQATQRLVQSSIARLPRSPRKSSASLLRSTAKSESSKKWPSSSG